MGILDKADHFKGVPLPQGSEFVKGMRSGGSAAMGSLNNLAGAVGQKLGAEEFATGRFAAADQYNADAAATAPRVASWRDVNGVGDFVDYAKGLAGGIVPVGGAALGATLLTGGGAIPAIAAGTAATALFETGDVVGRMRERGQPIDLTRAAVGGVGSAALQNVLPGVARARLGGTAGRLPGGALASIPEQAALAGAGELGKQQAAAPSEALDWAQAGEAAAAGAVVGAPIAGMSALGGARGQIGAAADAVGGKVKDAAQFVGDKAKGVTKATTEAADAGTKRVEGMEIPDALAGIFDSGKAKARDMLDKIAASEDVVGDISKFAGLQGEKFKAALAGDDGERLQAVKDYAKELGDQHPAVRDWMQDMGNHAKQAAVAAAKIAKDTKDTAMDHLTRFADSVDEWSNARKFKRTDGNKYAGGETVDAETRRVDPSPDGVVDAEVRDVTIRRLLKSEDDSGIRQALAEKLIPELLKARPELADMAGDPEVATQLHRAFAPLIEDLASGKRPSRDVVARLVDLAGPAADRLLEVAHSVVGDSTDKAKTATFFKSLNEFTKARDSADTLAQAQHKLLRPELQRSTSNHDLREEARLLMKWLDDKRPTEGPKADPEAQRLKYRMEKYLETRYGENSKKLLAALEKGRPQETNQLERARVKYDEDGQPIDSGVEDGYSESGSPNGQMRFFGGGAKGKDLFVHPEDDPGKNGFPGAAMQRLAKVQAMYPESTARFITASEMGPDHPWVEGRYEQLVKIGNEAGVDGERYAMKQLDRYGVIATERATHGTDISFDELDAMKFDRHKYDAKNSPAALHTGYMAGKDELVLDAVKVVRSMMARFKNEHVSDDLGEQARTARVGRMFIEGIAAVQAHIGKTFDIPNDTFLGKFDGRDVTWADIKKLDRRTQADRENDKTTNYLTGLRKAIMDTEDKELRKALIREDVEADAKRQLAKARDLTREDSRKVDDEPGTGYTSDLGIPMERRTHSRKTKDDFKTGEIGESIPGDMGLPNLTARMKRIGEVNGELGPIFERMEDGTATAADRVKATALRKELDVLSKVREAESTGRTEIDPFGPTHDALRGEGKLGIMKGTGEGMNTRTYDIGRAPEPIFTDGGEPRKPFLPQRINKPGTALPENAPGAARPKAEPTPDAAIGTDREYGDKSWPALRKAAAEAAKKFSDPAWDSDHAGFMLDGKRYSVQQERPGQWYVKNDEGDIIHSVGKAVKKPAGGAPPLDRRVADRVDALAASEDYSSLNTRPKVDAFLDAARKRFDELRNIDGDLTEQQSKALGTLYGLFGKGSTADLASFYDGIKEEPTGPKALAAKKAAFLERARSGDESLIEEVKQHTDAVGLQNAVLHLARKGDAMEPNTARVIDALNGRIGELVREHPQQAYDLLKTNKSMEGVDPNRQGPINRKEVGDYINRVLGNSVKVAWKNLTHAGEFERIDPGNAPIEDVIRLSVHAMNPLSTAFHESMHAFIQKLNDQKHGKIVDVLFKAGESAPVLNQLRAWMAERGMGEKALAQLKDPEERAAYMYQAWADGKLNVGDQTKTVLGKIADFIRSVLGIWSNDARALHIMEYFHSGDFAKNMANRDQVYKDLMVPGRNKAIETARKMTQPILELGENLGVAGAQRLRDTGIPALRELADQMKLHTVAEGDDPGFVPAARAERTRVMNKLAADLKDFSAESVQAALESLQQKSNDPIKAMTDQKARGDAFTAKVVVRKLLDDMYGYMTDAGVKVADLGVGKDYFPRQYDVSYISSHQQEFKNVLDRNGVKNADKVLSKIMVSEGAEFTTVVTDKPGMQHLKPRDLAFIPEAELAPFMRKNLTEILNGYVTQATRRAEWAKRFGDDGKGVNKLIAEAQRQGATPDDVDSAWKFVRAVDGTLGDTINPEARRLFGNMIVYQNVRLLPLMIFSSVVDPMGIMVRGGTMADSFAAFKRGVSEIPKNFKKNPQDDAATKFAASIGVIDDTTLVHTLGALYSQGMVGDTGRKINDTLFRYNLAEQFNTSMRVSATEAAMGFLARHADGTASPHSRRWLSELGLEPNELTVDANGRVKVTEADGLTPEQSAKVKAAVNRWVDGAVLRPDAADKPIWMSDPHWSLISHLKQFTYSFHETILKRVAHEYQNGNYTPAMALMSYVPMMIAADMAKGLIQGGGEEPEWKQNWGVGDYVAAGVERAGLLGVGQFGVDMLRDAVRGGTGVGALAGPTVEQFAEAARMLGGRESFGQFVLKSMPANALYAGAVDVEPADPKFVD